MRSVWPTMMSELDFKWFAATIALMLEWYLTAMAHTVSPGRTL